jgi:hypothetical protein
LWTREQLIEQRLTSHHLPAMSVGLSSQIGDDVRMVCI